MRQGNLEGYHVELYDIMALLPVSILSVGSHGGWLELGTVPTTRERGYTLSSCWGIPPPSADYSLSLSLSFVECVAAASGISFPPHAILLASQGFGAFLVPSFHAQTCVLKFTTRY